MTRYLSAEEVLVIHSLVVEETGGAHGVRDTALLESIIERPKAIHGGAELYGTLIAKAAVFCEAIVNYHIFVDGNKRTAFVSLSRFLFINGKGITATNDEVVVLMVGIADKHTDVTELAQWLEKNTEDI